MANLLNVYTGTELVVANRYYFPKNYNEAVQLAKKLCLPFVHGIKPADLKGCNLCNKSP